MTFDEVVLVEPGELLADFGEDEFWDYVIVEGSNDFGEIWWPLDDGYDSGDNSVWKQNYNHQRQQPTPAPQRQFCLGIHPSALRFRVMNR